MFLMCDRRDLGSAVESGENLPDPLFQPTIFIYDNFPGGIGLSRPLYELREQLLTATRQLIQSCPCADGCPSCVGPTVLAKEVAVKLLDAMNHA
jgi:DEAD/DEAH box helicase domain-containing protein